MARSGSQERTKGAGNQAQGRLKEAIGALTGNRRQENKERITTENTENTERNMAKIT